MAALTEQQMGIGISHNFVGLGDRYFERSGTVLYKARQQGLIINGVTYNVGTNITMDGPGGTSYTAKTMAILQRLWDAKLITPTV